MTDHYYTEKPQSDINEKHFTHEILGKKLYFTSVSGVFSFGEKIDKASEMLIRNYKPSGAHPSILDVGCGIGPIALFIKSRYINLSVYAVDINERAVAYTQKNAERNNLDIIAQKSDLYSAIIDKQFGDIVSNPPIAAGKAINTRLIEEAKEHLVPGGSLWLVAFHNKGGETLKKIMNATFGNVEDIEKSGGIRVYRSEK